MIVVLSDLHLGLASAPRPAELAPLFEGAQHVILNGDTTELSTPAFAARAAAQLAELRDAVKSHGAQCTVLAGNHDPDISADTHHILEEGRVLVTHGHAFHPMIVPWSPYAAEVGAEYRRVWEAMPSHAPLERALLAAGQAARTERQLEHARPPAREALSMCLHPWRSMQVVAFWRIYPELAAAFCERCAPEARMVVCGHSHRAGAWWVRNRLVLNTGCFTFPGTPHAVLMAEGQIALVPLQRTRNVWRYRAEFRRAWRIGLIAEAAAAASTPVV